jgi:uncharacterized protein YciI
VDLRLFVVHLRYGSSDQLARHHEEHAAWVDRYSADGSILLAGGTAAMDSGVILARASSREALVAILQADPFCRAGISTYEIVEFNPRRGALRRKPENPLYLSPTELEDALAQPLVPGR